MSKRQSKFYSGNEFKKPKLNISITSEAFPSTRNTTPPQTSVQDDEIWGDEDDAIFLIASQAYEENESSDMSMIANYTMCMRPPLTSTQQVVVNFQQGPINEHPTPSKYPPKSHNGFQKLSSSSQVEPLETSSFYTTANRLNRTAGIKDASKPSTSNNEFNSLLEGNLFDDDFGCLNEMHQDTFHAKNSSNNDTFKKPPLPYSNKDNINENNKNTSTLEISLNNKQIATNPSSVSTMASNEHMQNMLKQLRSFKLENEKLKHQHNILNDKCLTKDGEASILRSQLKSIQMQLDTIKLDKLKSHEKNQIEWNSKLQSLTKEVQSYKSQIEFKNLEINNANDKCRMLETSKIKFVEPTHPVMDNSSKRSSFSQKFNNMSMRQDTMSKSYASTKESTCQTGSLDNVILHPPRISYYPVMNQIHESLFHQQPSVEVPISFRSNKNSTLVEHSSYSYIRKRILNDLNKSQSKNKSPDSDAKLEHIYEDLSKISKLTQEEIVHGNSGIECALRITLVAKELLLKTLRQLQNLSIKITTQTLREMDTKYFEMSGKKSSCMSDKNVFDRSCWCKNEQAIEARRITAVVSVICKNFESIADFVMGLKCINELGATVDTDFLATLTLCSADDKNRNIKSGLVEIFIEICKNIGNIGCSHLFSGLLTSISLVIKRCIKRLSKTSSDCFKNIYNILKQIVLLRPNGTVILTISKILRRLSRTREFLEILCKNRDVSNVIFDMSQGVVLFNDESCFLQVLCSQIEVSALQHSSMREMRFIFELTDSILNLCYGGSYLNVSWASCKQDYRCQCSYRVYQCLAVCLHACSRLYQQHISYLNDTNLTRKFNATIRAGIMMMDFCVMRDIEFITRLGNHEGNYQLFVDNCNNVIDHLQLLDIHKEALADLTSSVLVPFFEDQETPTPEALNIWESSFNKFSTVE